jgi:hypothetical protein
VTGDGDPGRDAAQVQLYERLDRRLEEQMDALDAMLADLESAPPGLHDEARRELCVARSTGVGARLRLIEARADADSDLFDIEQGIESAVREMVAALVLASAAIGRTGSP